MNRDPLFTAGFISILESAGVRPVKLPHRSPNRNADAERFVRSIKQECLDRMIFLSEASLEYAINEYLGHYHEERHHQGLESQTIRPRFEKAGRVGEVVRHERLGGLLNFYCPKAA